MLPLAFPPNKKLGENGRYMQDANHFLLGNSLSMEIRLPAVTMTVPSIQYPSKRMIVNCKYMQYETQDV
jgi:hypothetical protein